MANKAHKDFKNKKVGCSVSESKCVKKSGYKTMKKALIHGSLGGGQVFVIERQI